LQRNNIFIRFILNYEKYQKGLLWEKGGSSPFYRVLLNAQHLMDSVDFYWGNSNLIFFFHYDVFSWWPQRGHRLVTLVSKGPADSGQWGGGKTTQKESPTARMGALLLSADDMQHIVIRGVLATLVPSVIERWRFQRLSKYIDSFYIHNQLMVLIKWVSLNPVILRLLNDDLAHRTLKVQQNIGKGSHRYTTCLSS